MNVKSMTALWAGFALLGSAALPMFLVGCSGRDQDCGRQPGQAPIGAASSTCSEVRVGGKADDLIIVLSTKPRDWAPTSGQRVQVVGIARNSRKPFPHVETDSHGDWLVDLDGRWPADVEGRRVCLTGVVALIPPVEHRADGSLVQGFTAEARCLTACRWERVESD